MCSHLSRDAGLALISDFADLSVHRASRLEEATSKFSIYNWKRHHNY